MNNWVVVKCNKCSNKSCWYGNDYKDYYECNECGEESHSVIQRGDWDISDIIAIQSDELEGGNYHSFTSMPEILVNSLKAVGIDDEKVKIVSESFFKKLWNKI